MAASALGRPLSTPMTMSISRRFMRFILLTVIAFGCVVLIAKDGGAVDPLVQKDRIYVDQYSPLRSEIMIADADGANPRRLLPGSQLDYNASFSFDGQSVIFSSERNGSADIFRARRDGTGLERLTDSPAYDDQAALSPDNRSVAFVSTRGAGSTDIYILDLATRKVRNLTNSPGGDFRPSWSADGQMIAFTSDRGTGFPHAAGRWEHLQAGSVYVIRADGTGLRKLTTDGEATAGSPQWSADGKRMVFYELAVKDTFDVRFGGGSVASRIVSIDVATGARTEHASGPWLKFSPQFVGPDRIAYLAKAGATATLTFTTGEKSTPGDIANPAWSRDGKQVVYHSGQIATMHSAARMPGEKLLGGDAQFDLVYGSGFPAVSPDGRQIVVSEREVGPGDRTALDVWDTNGTNPRRIFRGKSTVMGPEWSRDGRWIVFGEGSYFLERSSHSAQIMIVRPDGSDARALTTGPGNAGFPSWSPDGTQVVYRFWTETAGGLRIVNVATGAVRTLTTEYDTLPGWSPKGDRIVFSRLAKDSRFPYDEFDIYTIRPDGTDVKRLTNSEGNDSHSLWSPDGAYILWSSSRFGFKDEAALTISTPQPFAELFIMKADGSEQRALTDNQWEDGTPAWLPRAAKK